MDLLFRLITFCARNLMSVSRNHMHRAWRSRLSSSDGKDFSASMTKEQWLKQGGGKGGMRKTNSVRSPSHSQMKTAGIPHSCYALDGRGRAILPTLLVAQGPRFSARALKGWSLNSPGFGGHPVSAASTQSRQCSARAVTNDTQTSGHGRVPIQLYSWAADPTRHTGHSRPHPAAAVGGAGSRVTLTASEPPLCRLAAWASFCQSSIHLWTSPSPKNLGQR